MALSDLAAKNAAPREKQYKLADSGGLYLLVTPTGGKLWRFKFRIHGKEKLMAFGKYPEVTLAEARRRRDAARKELSGGIDPAALKARERVVAQVSMAETFGIVATEYIDKAEREGRAEATINKLRWLADQLRPEIGTRPVSAIEPPEILAALRRLEKAGNLETARRVRSFASRVFRYAVQTGRAKTDPAALLQGAVATPKVKHHAAILTSTRVGDLLRAIDAYSGQPATMLALKLAPHVFVRPGELRQAEWSEIDFGASVWRIPAIRTKTRREHALPLSHQAKEILEQARILSGHRRHIFPATGKPDRALSENTIVAALRRMDFGPDEMSAHGFRATASTLLNESGKWHPDAIERALAHKDADSVRAAYHRGAHWAERVEMAQWWSDYLDILRDGASVRLRKEK
ncbi:phage integrase central domain-containing protein [Acetobacter sp. P1H12_c]|uniref:tyrosine-type recombinase/integrase n=1 Tax=Acetobacter sp. P1H12_c TaxID=2762621 RepID=UPI001C048321|nr:integrase arm-type DNA-binding domain-containing protein [Acetobacter sp. P1H12_c]